VKALDADDLDAVRSVAGVDRVEPALSVQVEYVALGNRKVTGSVAELLPTDTPQIDAGSVADARKPGAAILGHGFLEDLGFAAPKDAVGKKVDLVVMDQLRKPRNYPVTVAAVEKPSFVGNAGIQIPRAQLEQMQQYQAAGVDDLLSKPTLAVAYLEPQASQETVKAGIKALGLTARTAADEADAAAGSLRPLQLAVLGFSLIAILAATFGIVNTLLMSVHERTREIGLLKALGSRNRQIFGQFVTEALLLGVWGAVMGMVLAVIAGGVISNVVASRAGESFPGLTIFAASVPTVLGAPLLIATVALLAGVLPARRAMRLDPISALRYE
jgi:putative ABC transport system permease protein